MAEKPTSLSSGVVERLTDLDSSQEEADTRLLVHAAHVARSKFVVVIIVSEDTEVLVLCLAFKSFIPSSMFIKCSSQTRVKYLRVSSIVERIGASTCKSLPGFHTFTGCDTVSAFQRRGKVLVFRIMAQDQGFQEVFQGLGKEWQLSNELYRDLQRFNCTMYCKNAGTNEVNKLRYRLFCLKKGDVDSNQLSSVALRIAPTGVMMIMSSLTMKMTMTMTMRTAMAGKGLVMKYRVVSKEAELVTGKKIFPYIVLLNQLFLCEP